MVNLFQDLKLWLESHHLLWVRIPTSDEEAENGKAPTHHVPKRQLIQDYVLYRWPWILSTFVFACIAGFLYTVSLSDNRRACALNCRWRKTDLAPASEHLREHEQRFSGALTYNASGKLIIESTPGEKKWVGNPTSEIDALWDRVELGSIVLLEGSESDMVRDKTLLFDGYWLTGLDVIHQMHCLNKIRKALYPEYYRPEQSASIEVLHVEHCLDYIRQAIMCNSDITPVPLTWYQSAQTFGPDFRTTHTCRDFEALLQWSLKRTSKALIGKGTGVEHAKVPSLMMPGSLQGLNGLSHGDHHGH